MRPVNILPLICAAVVWASGSPGVAGYLLVPDFDKNNVLRYDAATGAFVDELVPRRSGGLNQPWTALIGPDASLYVSTGHFRGPGQLKSVLRFNGATGEFQGEFVDRNVMQMPHAVTFGPDGNMYVGDRVERNGGHPTGGRILRFDATTGELIGEFVTLLSGGLLHPLAHVFGPDGDLYVTDEGEPTLAGGHDVKRYDGTTGAFKGAFVAAGSAIDDPLGLTFGPDGSLFVADFGLGAILRFQGPSGSNPGAPMPSAGNSDATFVAPGSGGLLNPLGVVFGPDGNGDGHQDIYVSNIAFTGFYGKQGNVRRYDGMTGAFIDTFVPTGSGGLDDPSLIAFTETDPVTLQYLGGPAQHAAIHGVPEPTCLLLASFAAAAKALYRSRRPGKR